MRCSCDRCTHPFGALAHTILDTHSSHPQPSIPDAYDEASMFQHCQTLLKWTDPTQWHYNMRAREEEELLTSPRSIMHVDIPGHLAAGGATIWHAGSAGVQVEARDLLRSRYIDLPPVFCSEFQAKQHAPMHSIREEQYKEWTVPQVSNLIAAFTQLDLNHEFRLRAHAETFAAPTDQKICVQVTTTTPSWMYSARACLLSTLASDKRIQTGYKCLVNVRSELSATKGEQRAIRIDFKRSFRTKPQVAAFLNLLHTDNFGTRFEITVSDIDQAGFTLGLETWLDTTSESYSLICFDDFCTDVLAS